MPATLCPEAVFGVFCKLPRVSVPSDGGVVKGQLTFEGGGMAFVDLDVLDAFCKLNLVG